MILNSLFGENFVPPLPPMTGGAPRTPEFIARGEVIVWLHTRVSKEEG